MRRILGATQDADGAHSMTANDRLARARLRLVALIASVTILSTFFRASSGVIAPELTRDLELTPELLGLASGSFFIALGLAQIPVGMLFDRIGPRRTVGLLSVLAIAGALLHAVAHDGTTLIAARTLLGFGSAASFMSAVLLISRWFPRERLATALSWNFALSQIGILLAATPLAWVAATLGWRWAFAGAAVATAVVAVAFHLAVRDDPPGAEPQRRSPEALRSTLAGIVRVWRIPDLGRILAMHLFAYAAMITVLGLWAGPYLADVHGLDAVARGNVLLAMGVAQAIGVLCVGPLDRLFNTRKWVIVGGAGATLAVLGALALISHPPTWLAVGLLVALCGVSTYSVVIVTHGRSLFPDDLAGRGVTTVNLAQVTGSAVLPVVTGAVLGWASADRSEAGYRLVFAVIGLALASGLAVYLRARDSKPRG